jgi:hypothetical protein
MDELKPTDPQKEKKPVAGEIEPIPHWSTGLQEKWGRITKEAQIIKEVILARKSQLLEVVGITAAACIALALWFKPAEEIPRPELSVADIIAMADEPDPTREMIESFNEGGMLDADSNEKTENNILVLLETIRHPADPETRFVMMGTPNHKSLILVETRNEKLVKMLDANEIQPNSRMEIETTEISITDPANEELRKEAFKKKATPAKLKKITLLN